MNCTLSIVKNVIKQVCKNTQLKYNLNFSVPSLHAFINVAITYHCNLSKDYNVLAPAGAHSASLNSFVAHYLFTIERNSQEKWAFQEEDRQNDEFLLRFLLLNYLKFNTRADMSEHENSCSAPINFSSTKAL